MCNVVVRIVDDPEHYALWEIRATFTTGPPRSVEALQQVNQLIRPYPLLVPSDTRVSRLTPQELDEPLR